MQLLADVGHAVREAGGVGDEVAVGVAGVRHPAVVGGDGVVALGGQAGGDECAGVGEDGFLADVAAVVGPVVPAHGRGRSEVGVRGGGRGGGCGGRSREATERECRGGGGRGQGAHGAGPATARGVRGGAAPCGSVLSVSSPGQGISRLRASTSAPGMTRRGYRAEGSSLLQDAWRFLAQTITRWGSSGSCAPIHPDRLPVDLRDEGEPGANSRTTLPPHALSNRAPDKERALSGHPPRCPAVLLIRSRSCARTVPPPWPRRHSSFCPVRPSRPLPPPTPERPEARTPTTATATSTATVTRTSWSARPAPPSAGRRVAQASSPCSTGRREASGPPTSPASASPPPAW